MDLAAANAASRRSRGRCATVAVDGMVFHQPVFIGDEVSLYCDIIKVGRTSMTIRVEAWRRSRTDDARNKVTEATFTFVAVDENRKPRPLPPEQEADRGKCSLCTHQREPIPPPVRLCSLVNAGASR